MGLTSALAIGRSALTASQLGITVAGNNLSNAATPGYTRQTMDLSPRRGSFIGNSFVGRGVNVDGITRKLDAALQSRLLNARSNEASALQRLTSYAEVESALGELTGFDFSSQLNTFFSAWSERANLLENSGVVVQQGAQLGSYMRRLRNDLSGLRDQVDAQLGAAAQEADRLGREIASLNTEITGLEGTGATASSLRDQRDILIGQLADLLDIDAVEQPDGQVDILVGSQPIVLAGTPRAIDIRRETINGQSTIELVAGDDLRPLRVDGGRIGGMLSARTDAVDSAIDALDGIAQELIFELNQLHATGANQNGLRTASSDLRIPVADRSLALNDPLNQTLAGHPFTPTNGGFLIHVKRAGTDLTTTVRIDVDLDGIDDTGAPGFGDDTSLEDIRAAINAVDGVRATFTPDGRLAVDADAGFEFSFAEDSSGVLGSIGINGFFTGENASDIAVRSELESNPGLLTTGRMIDGSLVENQTALDAARLGDVAMASLGGLSFRETWTNAVNEIGLQTGTAQVEAQAATVVRESLDAQRAAISGVSVDEETINLLTYQRQFQAAARIVSVADELLQELIAIV